MTRPNGWTSWLSQMMVWVGEIGLCLEIFGRQRNGKEANKPCCPRTCWRNQQVFALARLLAVRYWFDRCSDGRPFRFPQQFDHRLTPSFEFRSRCCWIFDLNLLGANNQLIGRYSHELFWFSERHRKIQQIVFNDSKRLSGGSNIDQKEVLFIGSRFLAS